MSDRSVGVTREVYDGLEAVRRSGRTNMFDVGAVQMLAASMGHHATVSWIEEQVERTSYGLRSALDAQYPKGIINGFHIIEEKGTENGTSLAGLEKSGGDVDGLSSTTDPVPGGEGSGERDTPGTSPETDSD